MFARIDGHALTDTRRGYMPRGCSPYAPEPIKASDRIILATGDRVTVLSVWSRNAYPGDMMELAYVMSDRTRECTHVPTYELHTLHDARKAVAA